VLRRDNCRWFLRRFRWRAWRRLLLMQGESSVAPLEPQSRLRYNLARVSRKDQAIHFDRDERRLAVRVLWAGNRIYTHCYHRVELRNPCILPERGPAILCCNHVSGLDPLLVQSVVPRPIVWMMAREFYEIQILQRLVFRPIDAIPVGRGGRDMAAMRHAIRALQTGRILGVFPEGRIEPTRELMEFQTGVALIAYRTGVSLYPAYLDGTQRRKLMVRAFIEPQEATLTFGQPMHLEKMDPDREHLEETTARLKAEIGTMRQAEERRRLGR
jgi:1-acyl-sn-glycerol-3-phosphate acyltransferase